MTFLTNMLCCYNKNLSQNKNLFNIEIKLVSPLIFSTTTNIFIPLSPSLPRHHPHPNAHPDTWHARLDSRRWCVWGAPGESPSTTSMATASSDPQTSSCCPTSTLMQGLPCNLPLMTPLSATMCLFKPLSSIHLARVSGAEGSGQMGEGIV